MVEALLVGIAGGLAGLGIATPFAGRLAFGPTTRFGGSSSTFANWFATEAFVAGLAISASDGVLGTGHARPPNAHGRCETRQGVGRPTTAWWMRAGVDLILVAGALAVFWASSRNNYTLVLAPEGVAAISVSYWAFLGPAMLWLGAALLLWRLGDLRAEVRTAAAGLADDSTYRAPRPTRRGNDESATPARLARAIVLLALAVSFAASTAVFNATYQQQAEADAQLGDNHQDVTVTPAPEDAPGPQAGSHDRRNAGRQARRTRPAPVRLRWRRPAGPLWRAAQAPSGPRHALQDAYFPGGTCSAVNGHPLPPARCGSRQRRNGQGFPAEPR